VAALSGISLASTVVGVGFAFLVARFLGAAALLSGVGVGSGAASVTDCCTGEAAVLEGNEAVGVGKSTGASVGNNKGAGGSAGA
jgi:hypothetical protein